MNTNNKKSFTMQDMTLSELQHWASHTGADVYFNDGKVSGTNGVWC